MRQTIDDQTHQKTKPYLNEYDLEIMTGRSVKSWQRDRVKGGGIPFIRCGGKILYDLKDVEDWLEKRKYESTSAYPALRDNGGKK